MKVSYSREQDILMIEVCTEPIDYAEEAGLIIAHFTKEHKLVLLEIMDAREIWDEARRQSIKEEVSELRSLITT